VFSFINGHEECPASRERIPLELLTFFRMEELNMEMLKRFIRDEQGLETIEYAIMAALIIVGLIVTLGLVHGSLVNLFTTVSTELDNAQP
jgi:Flp pilus assembly pilin Flp